MSENNCDFNTEGIRQLFNKKSNKKPPVLCVPSKSIVAGKHLFFSEILDIIDNEGVYIEREQAEQDFSYRQIIPYVSLITPDNDRIAYQRKKAHTESRLASLWSLGYGGHVEPQDEVKSDAAQTIANNIIREISEETGVMLNFFCDIEFESIICSSKGDVEKVHLGLCFRVSLTRQEVEVVFNTKTESRTTSLYRQHLWDKENVEWEEWSKIVIARQL